MNKIITIMLIITFVCSIVISVTAEETVIPDTSEKTETNSQLMKALLFIGYIILELLVLAALIFGLLLLIIL